MEKHAFWTASFQRLAKILVVAYGAGLTVPLIITLRVYLTNPQFSMHSRQNVQ